MSWYFSTHIYHTCFWSLWTFLLVPVIENLNILHPKNLYWMVCVEVLQFHCCFISILVYFFLIIDYYTYSFMFWNFWNLPRGTKLAVLNVTNWRFGLVFDIGGFDLFIFGGFVSHLNSQAALGSYHPRFFENVRRKFQLGLKRKRTQFCKFIRKGYDFINSIYKKWISTKTMLLCFQIVWFKENSHFFLYHCFFGNVACKLTWKTGFPKIWRLPQL